MPNEGNSFVSSVSLYIYIESFVQVTRLDFSIDGDFSLPVRQDLSRFVGASALWGQ